MSSTSPDADSDATWLEQSSNLKSQADALFKSTSYTEAITLYTSAISIDPTNHLLYSNRSACLMKSNEISKALKDGEKCIALKPDWGKGYSRMAAAEFALGRFEAAVKTYDKGIGVEPGNAALIEGRRVAFNAKVVKDKAKADEIKAEEERLKNEAELANKPAEEEEEDLLGDFFGEVEQTIEETSFKVLPPKEIQPQEKYTNQPLGTSLSQINRVLSSNYEWKNLNPIYVLQLDVDANDEDVKTRYRKLSAIVHPDKNIGVDNAGDAFSQIKKAYNAVQTVELRKHCIALIEAGRSRAKKGFTGTPEELVTLQGKEVMKVFAEVELARRETEKKKLEFKKRERSHETEEVNKRKKEYKFEKEWQGGDRQKDRMSGWQDFKKGKKK